MLAQDLYEDAMRKAKTIPAVPPSARPSRLSSEARKARRPIPISTQLALKEDPVQLVATSEGKPAHITKVRKS